MLTNLISLTWAIFSFKFEDRTRYLRLTYYEL